MELSGTWFNSQRTTDVGTRIITSFLLSRRSVIASRDRSRGTRFTQAASIYLFLFLVVLEFTDGTEFCDDCWTL